MADAYTDMTSGVSLGLNLVKTGFDKAVAFKLRSEPLFRNVADTRATDLTNPGESVVFNIYDDLAATETDLDEILSPDAVAVPSTNTVTVTLKEMGNVVIPTLRLRTLSFADIDPAVANIVARNVADSVDARVQTKLRGGTNVLTSNAGAVDTTPQATNTLTAADILGFALADTAVSGLRGKNVIERMGNTFVGFSHPHTMFDFRQQSGANGWRYPHTNTGDGSAANVWVGQTGVYGGVTWVETPRCFKANDGAASATVYRTYIVGAQALAEVVAIEPHVVIGPVTDKLARHRPLGWHGLAGWSIYRQEAMYRIEAGSSLGAITL